MNWSTGRRSSSEYLATRVSVSRPGCSCQFGRASAPIMPQAVGTRRVCDEFNHDRGPHWWAPHARGLTQMEKAPPWAGEFPMRVAPESRRIAPTIPSGAKDHHHDEGDAERRGPTL